MNNEKSWQFFPQDSRYGRDAPNRAERLEVRRAAARASSRKRYRGRKEIRDTIAVQLIALRIASINRARLPKDVKLEQAGPTPAAQAAAPSTGICSV